MLKITEYADRLIDDLKDVDYLDRIKSQTNKTGLEDHTVQKLNSH